MKHPIGEDSGSRKALGRRQGQVDEERCGAGTFRTERLGTV